MKVLKFSPPSYTAREVSAVQECIENQWTGSGPKLKEFESKFAKYKNASYSSGFSSCTSALFLALKALEIGPGDEVVTTAMTFCSTVNVILHCGATPVLCDVEPFSLNIDKDCIERAITARTKALIVVHYAGYPCEMNAICELAESHSIPIVEDCAHAIETLYRGRHAGTFGTIGCFSFYATKNISIGEGGMAISGNSEIIDKMTSLGLHGLSRAAWNRFSSSKGQSYDVVDIGYKMNMTDIQAAIGIEQLERIEEMSTRRRQIWSYYSDELKDIGIDFQSSVQSDQDRHAMHLYVCALPSRINRDEFVARCAEDYKVIHGIHYNAIPTFSAYRKLFSRQNIASDLAVALDWGSRTFSLSLSAALSDQDCMRVVESTRKTIKAML